MMHCASQSDSQSVTVRDHRHIRPKCHVSYHSHTRAALTCTSATIPKLPRRTQAHHSAPDTRSDSEWREAVCVARRFRHLQWHPGLGLGLGGPAAGSTAWCLLTGDQTRDGIHRAAHLGSCADPSRNPVYRRTSVSALDAQRSTSEWVCHRAERTNQSMHNSH